MVLFVAGLDVVEDENYTLSDLRDEFGDEVAALVYGASEPEELINTDEDKSKTWPERKTHTIDLIKNADRDLEAPLLCRQISQYTGHHQGL